MQSRSDGEALKKIISGLKPQEVILLGSNPKAVNEIAEHCRTMLMLKDEFIHTPSGLDVVNCTKEGDIYQVRKMNTIGTSHRLQLILIQRFNLGCIECFRQIQNRAA